MKNSVCVLCAFLFGIFGFAGAAIAQDSATNTSNNGYYYSSGIDPNAPTVQSGEQQQQQLWTIWSDNHLENASIHFKMAANCQAWAMVFSGLYGVFSALSAYSPDAEVPLTVVGLGCSIASLGFEIGAIAHISSASKEMHLYCETQLSYASSSISLKYRF